MQLSPNCKPELKKKVTDYWMNAARDANIATEEWLHGSVCCQIWTHTFSSTGPAGRGWRKGYWLRFIWQQCFFWHFGNKTCSLLDLYKVLFNHIEVTVFSSPAYLWLTAPGVAVKEINTVLIFFFFFKVLTCFCTCWVGRTSVVLFPTSDSSFSEEWEFKQKCSSEKEGHQDKSRNYSSAI